MNFTAPTITTERLILRHHRLDDFEPMAELFSSDRSAHMGGPISRKKLWYWLLSEIGSWSILGFGSWAIDLRDSDICIGQLGLNQPIHFPEPELGWVLYHEHEGKGYAYEAAIAARQFAYDTVGLKSLVSYIAPDNTRSIALAKRLGARLDRNADRHDPSDLVYRHPAPEAPQ